MTIIKKLALAGSAAAIAMATPAFADPYTPPSAAGTATVRLYDAIEFEKVQDIDFGTVIRGAAWAGGDISMDANGATDCAALTDVSCTGSPGEGHFTIKGDDGSDMSVTMSSLDFDPVTSIMTLSNGTDSVELLVAVSGMTQDTDPVTSEGLNSFTVTGTGAVTDIKLYGDLTVGTSAQDPNGVYQASFQLTADYK